jgi:hypothetical protein
MTVKNAAAIAPAASNLAIRARRAGARLNPRGDAMTLAQLQQRADAIDKVIRARAKLQQLRNRVAAIEGALERFKARREALRA